MHSEPVLRHALLIGISAYRQSGIPPLPGVASDITALKEQLAAPDFTKFEEIIICQGEAGYVKGQQLRESIEIFLKAPIAEGSRRLNLIYIGCHAQVDIWGALQLIPSDYDSACSAATSVPISFLGSCLPFSTSATNVILLDCCFAASGAWDIFSRQPIPLQIPTEKEPAYCLVASTRPDEPALDGAFIPLLIEGLNRVEPSPGSRSAVGIDAIYDYLATRLIERHYQKPRLWQSRSLTIPIGKASRGLRLSRDSVRDILLSLPGRELTPPSLKYKDSIDFIEERAESGGHRTRTGFRLLEAFQGEAAVNQAIKSLSASVQARVINKGTILIEDDDKVFDAVDDDVVVLSFRSFRRAYLPYVRFLEDEIKAYEAEQDGVFRRDCYIHLKAREQGNDQRFILDEYILNWKSADAAPAVLVILGEFGVGKTTTARRIFWHQAQAHLESAAKERLPIFVSLREIEKIFDLEALIERVVHRQDSSGHLTAKRINELNQTGGILWILDGFDEMATRVSDRDLKRNFNQILRLVAPDSRLLLTCRTAYFKTPDELDKILQGTDLYIQLRKGSDGRCQVVYVDPLGTADVEKYFIARDRDRAADSLEILRSNPQIATLASRPLLLEMLVETLPVLKNEGIAINHSNVYQTYTSILLAREDWRDTIETPEDRIRFCRELAWYLLRRSSYEVRYTELPPIIRGLFPEMARTAEEFAALERSIRTTAFLARDEKSGAFSFAHKSFMEYFAAGYLLGKLDLAQDQELGSMVLPLEVARFLGQALERSPTGLPCLTEFASPAEFSLSYFFRSKLPGYIVPTTSISWRDITIPHMFEVVALGVIFFAVAVFPMIVPFEFSAYVGAGGIEKFYSGYHSIGLIAVSLLLTMVIYSAVQLAIYAFRVLSRTEGNPTLRFNSQIILALANKTALSRDCEALVRLLPKDEQKAALRVISSMRNAIQSTSADSVTAEVSVSETARPLNRFAHFGAWILGFVFSSALIVLKLNYVYSDLMHFAIASDAYSDVQAIVEVYPFVAKKYIAFSGLLAGACLPIVWQKINKPTGQPCSLLGHFLEAFPVLFGFGFLLQMILVGPDTDLVTLGAISLISGAYLSKIFRLAGTFSTKLIRLAVSKHS